MNVVQQPAIGWPEDREASFEHLSWWQSPAGVERGYGRGRFGLVHFRRSGPDKSVHPPLVCLHQSPSSGRAWEQLMVLLGRDRVVLAPDTPGFGDSDAPAEPPTIAAYAAAIGDLLDGLGFGTFDVLGDHTGSKIAVELAQQRPGQVRKVALHAAPIYGAAQIAAQQRLLIEKRGESWKPASGDVFRTRWAEFRRHYDADAPTGLVDRDFGETLRARKRTWFGYHAAYSYFHAENLPKLEQPVLVLCTNDGLWDETQRAADYLKNGRVMSLPEWRVGSISRRAEALADMLRQFLDAPGGGSNAAPKAAPDTGVAAPAAIMRRFVATPAGQMHLRVIEGDRSAPPLLCLHMSPRSSAYYEDLLHQLAGPRTVMAVDSPGYGESFKPSRRPDIADYAAAMVGLIEALGCGKVDLLGDHTGVKTAIETTRRRPDLVRRIVMNTAGVYSAEEQKAWQGRMGSIPVQDDGGHLDQLWDRYQSLNSGKLDQDQIAFRFYETLRAGPCMWWGPRAANLYLLGEVLPHIEHETLLVCSDADALLEPSRRGAKLLRNGRYVEFKGLGNSMLEYAAKECAPTIAGFLAS
jgi:pimeloyl-ACP methyl ester carboxylesterase